MENRSVLTHAAQWSPSFPDSSNVVATPNVLCCAILPSLPFAQIHADQVGGDSLGIQPDPHRPIPEFLYSLTRMLTEPANSSLIDWLAGRIRVHDPKRVESEVLGKYFRHSNYASFQRQLNYFGFRKIHASGGKGRMSPCSFQNDDTTEDLCSILSIKRKTAKRNSAKIASSETPDCADSPTKKKRRTSEKKNEGSSEPHTEGTPGETKPTHEVKSVWKDSPVVVKAEQFGPPGTMLFSQGAPQTTIVALDTSSKTQGEATDCSQPLKPLLFSSNQSQIQDENLVSKTANNINGTSSMCTARMGVPISSSFNQASAAVSRIPYNDGHEGITKDILSGFTSSSTTPVHPVAAPAETRKSFSSVGHGIDQLLAMSMPSLNTFFSSRSHCAHTNDAQFMSSLSPSSSLVELAMLPLT